MKIITTVAIVVAAILATSCGGGGGGGAAASTQWHPALTDTWQLQLKGAVNPSYAVAVYDIDLFDTPVATIQALQAAGKKVVCYFSAGSYEDWRSDRFSFQPADKGNAMAGWPGEWWLDTRSANVRQIMQARLDIAVSKGCNGVDPDNVNGYTNSSGFPLTALTQLDYNRFLATEAHKRKLAVALKNDTGQLSDLVGDFDFSVNEQCHIYSECAGYQIFIGNNKPVFNVEYASSYINDPVARQTLCTDAHARSFHTLVLPLLLDDSFRYSCDP